MAIDYSLDGGKRWTRVSQSIPSSGLFNFSILTKPKAFSGNQGISCQIRVTSIPPEEENETIDNSIQSDYNTRMENEWMNDVQAGSYRDTYYIHSFDGKLLSEYDGSGNCLRDYLYMGNRLIGDYQPGDGKYHYYMSDQVNSTRVIGDDSGNVVYSEAYGPYGDLQKSFKTDYVPRLKYSGKEREADSGLDYFGARYFQNRMYRFISVDPFVDKDKALVNPQSWNLYAYCRNNPITYFDPDGRETRPSTPDDLPKPPGWNKKWEFKGRGKYDPVNEPNYPGHYVDDKGNRWEWDQDPKNYHGGPHWDVDQPQAPGSKKFYNDEKHRTRYRPDGTVIPKKPNAFEMIAKGALTVGAGYLLYRTIRFLPSLLPPLWFTAVPNLILP